MRIYRVKALQGLADGADGFLMEEKMKGKQKKKSRFLRNHHDDNDHQEEDRHVGELANSILGLRNDSMGDYDKYRPEPSRFSRRTDLEDEPVTSRKTFVDEDDTDILIKNLLLTSLKLFSLVYCTN